MPRIACLLVPDLPIAAACRADPDLAGRPLALSAGTGTHAPIVAAAAAARACGVRVGHTVAQALAIAADLVVRPRMRLVERDGETIDLSATEFDLLYFLASHARQVFTRQQLLDWVWHYGYFGDSRTVTVHMSRLRKKVEPDPANPRHLRTVWGVGYKFMP